MTRYCPLCAEPMNVAVVTDGSVGPGPFGGGFSIKYLQVVNLWLCKNCYVVDFQPPEMLIEDKTENG